MSKVRLYVAVTVLMLVLGSSLSVTASAGAYRHPLRVLVTNDDGVGAPGIAVLVDALQTLHDVQVRVVAPATNQSGTGGNFSSTPISVAQAMTASGDAATAVTGFPADTVLYDVLAAHDRPDLVVSGINLGQNLGNITEVSGTVGAARTANRLGIPAIAVSAGIAANVDYPTAARLVAMVVGAFRQRDGNRGAAAQTLNLNVPSCETGHVRGIEWVPLGQTNRVAAYTAQSGSIDSGTFAPSVATQNAVAVANCTSTLSHPADDIEAFNNGFVSATVLNPDYTDRVRDARPIRLSMARHRATSCTALTCAHSNCVSRATLPRSRAVAQFG